MADQRLELGDFAERMASLLIAAGLQRMPARVLMALMTSEDGGLTSQELQDRLGVSAAAISGAAQYLRGLSMVRRVAQSGSRRDRYELPDDVWYTASVQADTFYLPMAQLAEAAAESIDDTDSPSAARIREMADFFRFMQRRLPELLDEWEGQRNA
ncbi:GbsR/MarR family transcriptional regulator [Glaciibacter sp. 2TAF33]|uniref:GbsR/MarR family transcriptional regulator n=1 Tax=Glaciibacter sp. 2TAF33 TaxID=3233015 RepID=UPI003F92833D